MTPEHLPSQRDRSDATELQTTRVAARQKGIGLIRRLTAGAAVTAAAATIGLTGYFTLASAATETEPATVSGDSGSSSSSTDSDSGSTTSDDSWDSSAPESSSGDSADSSTSGS